MVSPIIGGLIFAEGGSRLLGTWTAILAVAAFVAAYALLPRPQALPSEPAEAATAEDCVAECAPV